MLPVIIAVTVSFLIVDLFGAQDFTDSVIESKEVFINSLSKEELEELFSFEL